ncbi:TonB-dependent siderophore receptor [Alcaligenes sp. RM2]
MHRRPDPLSLSKDAGSHCAPLRPLALALYVLMAGSAFIASTSPAQATTRSSPTADKTQRYDIPAGPLSRVLMRFSQESGVYLVGAGSVAEGKQSAGLKGNYSVTQALDTLLAGTGIRYSRDANTVNLWPVTETTQLEPVRVKGTLNRATEDTGLYTLNGTSSTATRLNMDTQHTPQSVSVMTRQQMDDFGLTSFDDVMNFTTGVTANTAAVGGGFQFQARGFDISNVQVDGVQSSYRAAGRGAFNPISLDMDLYDRVEVVRGATGLLSPTGEPSALINLIRKRPQAEFGGKLSAHYGSWNDKRVTADVTGPLTEDGRLRMRVIGSRKQADSFMDRQDHKNDLLSGMLEFDLTDRTLLTAGYDYQTAKLRGEGNMGVPLFTSEGDRIDVSRSMSLVPDWTYWDKKHQNAFFSVEHEFENKWNAKLSYSHQRDDGDALITGLGQGVNPVVRPDGSGIGIRANLAANGYRHQDNLELSANGPFELFGREHQLMFGFNGTRKRDTTYTMQVSDTRNWFIPNIYDWDGYMPEPSVSRTGEWNRVHTREYGFFAGTRLNIIDPLNVIMGLRLSDYKTYRDNYGKTGQFTGVSNELRNRNEITPYFGVTYDINPNLTAYASYTRLFQPQSYKDINENFLDPITGVNREIGLKGSLMEEALQFSLAAFETRQNNLAVLDPSVPDDFLLPDGSRPYVSSGAGNKTKGFEVELSGALTNNWNVFASYSYASTKNGEGERINTYIPSQTFRLGTMYQFSGALQGLSAGATVNWFGKRDLWTAGRPYTASNGKALEDTHSSYALVGLHANYRVNQHWNAKLTVNNLFDKRYYDNFVIFRARYGAPRNVHLSIDYQW